ncbi:MAG: Rrf2 family transcriptional regulator [Candidatus Moranbacteria bacterium]|nr:Rrf2 family transcriptional regulator [Candidatus Moranbacteria bacterium]
MKFSTKAEYGLRAMVNLARVYPEKKNIKEISVEENISMKYLERIVGDLRKSSLVESSKGKNGGYVLSKKPAAISVGEIVEVLEGPLVSKCDHEGCAMSGKCSSSLVWGTLNAKIRETLFGIRLSKLI